MSLIEEVLIADCQVKRDPLNYLLTHERLRSSWLLKMIRRG